MQKRVFIVHGWGFTPKDNWYSWLKTKLQQHNFQAEIPLLSNTDEPVIQAWVEHLTEADGVIDLPETLAAIQKFSRAKDR